MGETRLDYAAIANAIRQRKAQTGLSWKEIGRRSPDAKGEAMDTSTIWHARNYGQRDKARAVNEDTLRRLDRGLEWPEGTLEGIGNGSPYPEPEPTAPEKIEAIERDVAELRRDLASLRDQIDQLAHALGQEG